MHLCFKNGGNIALDSRRVLSSGHSALSKPVLQERPLRLRTGKLSAGPRKGPLHLIHADPSATTQSSNTPATIWSICRIARAYAGLHLLPLEISSYRGRRPILGILINSTSPPVIPRERGDPYLRGHHTKPYSHVKAARLTSKLDFRLRWEWRGRGWTGDGALLRDLTGRLNLCCKYFAVFGAITLEGTCTCMPR